MRKVKIIADTSCDVMNFLGNNKVDLSDVDFVPLNITIGYKTYKDFFELPSLEIIKKAEELNTVPKTAAPSIGDYSVRFEKYLKEDYDIVCLCLGKEFSSTYNNACIAANDFEKGRIFVVDSNSLSSGMGIKIFKALDLVKEGKSAEEIATILDSKNTVSHCEFVCDTMNYIYKGGRCSGVEYLLGVMLRIKPLIMVNSEGKMNVDAKPLGKRLGDNYLLNRFKEHFLNNEMDNKYYLITAIDCDVDIDYLFKGLVEMGVPKENIYITEANGTVTSHCGPGCIGLIYLEK